MKLLFFTDAHIRGDSPQSRIDDYQTALYDKFLEIQQIIKEEKIDAVLNGGDLFHTPAPATSVIVKFLKVMKSWNVPIYSIHGSHDKFGYNENTIHRTALGIAEAAGITGIIDVPIELAEGIFVCGTHHSYVLDKITEEFEDETRLTYTIKKPEGCKYLIQLAHGMLVPKPFFGEYTLLTQVKTDSNLVLSGHYHPGFEPVSINGTLFVNPGSLGRVDIAERVFSPSVVLIDTNTKEVIRRPLKNVNLNVFMYTETKNVSINTIDEFMATLKNRIDSIESYDVNRLIITIAEQEKVAPEIIKKALKYVE